MKTAQCPAGCGRGNLAVRTSPDGLTTMYVDRDSGLPHYLSCPNKKEWAWQPRDSNGVPTPDPDTNPLDMEVLRDLVRDETERTQQAMRDALPKLTALSVTMAQDQIREQVRSQVGQMVPSRHIIEIHEPDGTKVEIEGRPHKKFEVLCQWAKLGRPIMMVGPAGSGKTTAAQMVAQVLGRAYYEASMGPQTSQADLLGYKSPIDGKYYPGILREGYENGGVIMLDELDNSNPNVLTVLNSALANGHCRFPDQMVERHPDCLVIAGANTYGKGGNRVYTRFQLDGATIDRFKTVDWDYDEDAEIQWAGVDQRHWTEYVQRVRKIADEFKMRVIVSPRASIDGAQALRAGIDRDEVEAACLWAGMSIDDKARILENLRKDGSS